MRRGIPWWVVGAVLIVVAVGVAALATTKSPSVIGHLPAAIHLPAVAPSAPSLGVGSSPTTTGDSPPKSTVETQDVVIPANRTVVAEVEGATPSVIPPAPAPSPTTTTRPNTDDGGDESTTTTTEQRDH